MFFLADTSVLSLDYLLPHQGENVYFCEYSIFVSERLSVIFYPLQTAQIKYLKGYGEREKKNYSHWANR